MSRADCFGLLGPRQVWSVTTLQSRILVTSQQQLASVASDSARFGSGTMCFSKYASLPGYSIHLPSERFKTSAALAYG